MFKKNTYALIALCLLFLQAFTSAKAANCLRLKDNSFAVKWTAFKTPAKVGVGGSFTDYDLNGKTKASSLEALLKGFKITINTGKNSVETGNQPRDVKISRAVFSTISNDSKIFGQITKVTNKTISLRVKMNGVTKNIPLSYTLEGDEFRASGYLDVLDFNMMKQLEAITRACKALHQGKTWNDVKLSLEADIHRDC